MEEMYGRNALSKCMGNVLEKCMMKMYRRSVWKRMDEMHGGYVWRECMWEMYEKNVSSVRNDIYYYPCIES